MKIDLICNHCGKLFKRRKPRKNILTFCSRDCLNESQRTGAVKEKKKAYFIEKYGVENPYASENVKNKIKETCLERFGVENPAQSKDVLEKIQQTSIKKYGTKNPRQSKIISDKIEKTCLERYGSKTTFGSEEISKKAQRVLIQNYGENYMSNVRDGIYKNHGVTNAYSIPSVKLRANSPKAIEKRFKTWVKNGKMLKSTGEDELFEVLKIMYDEIDRHPVKNGWSIDMYVKDIDTYFQFDGVYFHGLNQPIDEIKKKTNPQAKAICRKYYRDIEQVEWFLSNNLKLIRITDIEWKGAIDKVALIKEKLALK